jgi:2-oxoglutarate dehydrogenase E2 component (dihydrolipoamide succinyltransferase)
VRTGVKKEITIPSVGESVTQGILSAWLRAQGEQVTEGSDLLELETDKATVTIPSPATGTLLIAVAAGSEVNIGQVIGSVDTEGVAANQARPAFVAPAAPVMVPAPVAAPTPVTPPALPPQPTQGASRPELPKAAPDGTGVRREPMSTLRRRIAARLVEAQHATASLTTFNEVNMQKVSDLRSRYKEEFQRAHGVKLGFMSFFARACCVALAEMPVVNARIDGDQIVYSDSLDIGVAVSTERGLVVPVIKDAARRSLAELEAAIADLAGRARDRRIRPDELAGGTFSITNGGVFGSLLSTPILNYPQVAIFGMHAIQRRPVAEVGPDQKEIVVVRPMMYVALTYDHRLVDGREAVTFLRRVKELVEDPWRLFIEA